MYNRKITAEIKRRIGSGKVILLIGPRQVGKTTLIKNLLDEEEYLFLDCDDPVVKNLLTEINTEEIKRLLKGKNFVFIDEAQRVEGIGLTIKIIVDQIKPYQLFVSGSSAFEIKNLMNEPLTGRKWEYHLLPISWQEFEEKEGFLKSEQQLALRLVYGLYPDVLNEPGDEVAILNQLVNSYLYKDVLQFSQLKKPKVLEDLLRALAYQVGSEVSLNELSSMLSIDKNTVKSYITILEQAYIIFRLGAFSKNLRNEIKTNQKIYFYDNGIRNTLIGDFKPFDQRQDKGLLWENFIISERIKSYTYAHQFKRPFFWRTKFQQEIDFIEEYAGQLEAFEIKWSTKSVKTPPSFLSAYGAEVQAIDKRNFRDFLFV